MARKKVSQPTGETRTFFAFPWIHKAVMKAVSHNITFTWVRKSLDDEDADNEYETYVMGQFRCMNNACGTYSWSSKQVTILIRGYAGRGYNAVVFNQRCRSCNMLGTFTLNKQSYVERVAYRIQKWAGIKMEQPYYGPKEGLPHRQARGAGEDSVNRRMMGRRTDCCSEIMKVEPSRLKYRRRHVYCHLANIERRRTP